MTFAQAIADARREAFQHWFDEHGVEVFVGADGRFHAGPNGAVGANDEFYAPGQWVATSEETVKGLSAAISRRAAELLREDWYAADPGNKAFSEKLFDFCETHDDVFLDSLNSQLRRKGYLSEKQVAAGKSAMTRAEQREADRAERDALNSKSDYIGTVGERREFTVKVEASVYYETQYGVYWINICRDQDDNVIVYKGTKELTFDFEVEKGEFFTMKATIKDHAEYQGTKQTVVSRPAKAGGCK